MEDDDDLFTKKDLRKRKEKKRMHKQTKDMEDCTRENFKKMKEEIDELRKKELDRAKEFAELKKKIEEQSQQTSRKYAEPEYALQFTKDAYLNKGFIESAKWIKEIVAKNMIEKMNADENKERFEVLQISKKASTHIGIRTCARYNRGEICNFGKWHATHKPDFLGENGNNVEGDTYLAHRLRKLKSTEVPQSSIQERIGIRNEIRIHSCTLCMEAFGTAIGHSVLNCPWILKKNWN